MLPSTKQISLSNSETVTVDESDYDFLSRFRWWKHGRYARGRLSKESNPVYMHRVILCPGDEFSVDHINGNGLDNRRINFRVCVAAENNRNNVRRTPGLKGAYFHKVRQRWYSKVGRVFLGYFDSETLAAQAYDEYVVTNYGSFARPNFGGAHVQST